jgi:hypothetical protein
LPTRFVLCNSTIFSNFVPTGKRYGLPALPKKAGIAELQQWIGASKPEFDPPRAQIHEHFSIFLPLLRRGFSQR